MEPGLTLKKVILLKPYRVSLCDSSMVRIVSLCLHLSSKGHNSISVLNSTDPAFHRFQISWWIQGFWLRMIWKDFVGTCSSAPFFVKSMTTLAYSLMVHQWILEHGPAHRFKAVKIRHIQMPQWIYHEAADIATVSFTGHPDGGWINAWSGAQVSRKFGVGVMNHVSVKEHTAVPHVPLIQQPCS